MKTLIADSGGTGTDWCLIDENEEKNFFSTESYHPNNWNDAFFNRMKLFWADFDCTSIKLHFFGAGCLSAANYELLSGHFKSLKFNFVKVKSDLHAAGYCTLGMDTGTVAILGTGSVLFSWENQDVRKIIGGKGHLDGDEGSGYYFGKLILSAYLSEELSDEQASILKSQCPSIDSIEITNKFDVARIAGSLATNTQLFKEYHLQNFQLFAAKHFQKKESYKLHVVGSYGAHHREFLEQELAKVDSEIIQVIAKPITQLTEQNYLFID